MLVPLLPLELVVLLLVLPLHGAASAAAKTKSNFVFIFCDDMRKDDMAALPRLREHIAERGTYMENFFVNTPVRPTHHIACSLLWPEHRSYFRHRRTVRAAHSTLKEIRNPNDARFILP